MAVLRFLLFAFLFLVPSCLAVITISPTGTYTTLSAGIQAGILANDMNFQILAGNYSGASNRLINFGGRAFTLTAPSGPSRTFLTDDPLNPSGQAFFVFSNDSGIIDGLTLESAVTIANIPTGANIRFRNCVMTNFITQGIIFAGSSNVVIENTIVVNGNGVTAIQAAGTAAGSLTIVGSRLSASSGTAINQASTPVLPLNVTNSIFLGFTTAINWRSGSVNLVNNKFFKSQISCTATTTFTGSINQFCGAGALQGTCTGTGIDVVRPTIYSPHDSCGICGGNNEFKNCQGNCFVAPVGACPTYKTIYVSNNGTGNGLKRNQPASLTNAISSASYNDTIVLLTGTYTVSSPVNVGGKAITLRSDLDDPTTVIIQCNDFTKAGIYANTQESFDTVFRSLSIQKCGAGIHVLDASPTIDNCIISNNSNLATYALNSIASGVILAGASFSTVRNSLISDNEASSTAGLAVDTTTLVDGVSNSVVKIESTRFLRNNGGYTAGFGTLFISRLSSVTVTNSFFESNRANSAGTPAAVRMVSRATNSLPQTFTGNSFFGNGVAGSVGSTISCDSTSTVIQSNNNFCGPAGSTQISCGTWTASSTTPDSCNVCGGSNSKLDCLGVCFGYAIRDSSTVCCNTINTDCNRRCSGQASYDVNGVCCLSNQRDCTSICFGVTQCTTGINGLVTTHSQQTTQIQTTSLQTTVLQFTTELQITTDVLRTTAELTTDSPSISSGQNISHANAAISFSILLFVVCASFVFLWF